jgi:hypothetical protein
MAALVPLALAACEADRETFEAGADMDAPPAVEQAPAAPISSDELPSATTDRELMEEQTPLQETEIDTTAVETP